MSIDLISGTQVLYIEEIFAHSLIFERLFLIFILTLCVEQVELLNVKLLLLYLLLKDLEVLLEPNPTLLEACLGVLVLLPYFFT